MSIHMHLYTHPRSAEDLGHESVHHDLEGEHVTAECALCVRVLHLRRQSDRFDIAGAKTFGMDGTDVSVMSRLNLP